MAPCLAQAAALVLHSVDKEELGNLVGGGPWSRAVVCGSRDEGRGNAQDGVGAARTTQLYSDTGGGRHWGCHTCVYV